MRQKKRVEARSLDLKVMDKLGIGGFSEHRSTSFRLCVALRNQSSQFLYVHNPVHLTQFPERGFGFVEHGERFLL